MTRQLAKLGNTVIDVTTGVKGIAFQYLELITGSVQIAIQPKLETDNHCATGTEAALPGLNVDIQLLDVVDEGIADRVVPAAPETIALGNEVEELSTGQRGLALTRITFINGCVYYKVQVKPTEKQITEGTMPHELFVSSKMIKVVGPGLVKEAEKNTAAPVATRPGGPSTKMVRV